MVRAGRDRSTTRATRRRASWSRAATPSCTSPACPTRRARAPTPPAPCARTRARRSTCSRAALEHGAGLVYPSTVRAAVEPPPDAYALSKRLGENACRLHPAPGRPSCASRRSSARARSWRGRHGSDRLRSPPGRSPASRSSSPATPSAPATSSTWTTSSPRSSGSSPSGRWNETLTVASGVATPLLRAAELVREAAGSSAPIETPGGELPPGENESYGADAPLDFSVRPLEEAIPAYVDWLAPTAAQGRARARADRRPPRRRRLARARALPCAGSTSRATAAVDEAIARLVGPRRAPSPPRRRSPGRAARSCASTGSTTRRAPASSAAPASPPGSARRS